MRFYAALVAGVLFTATVAGAADTVIKGIVTDSNGKPVRGAIVKATLDIKSISRFTQSDGRYEIAVAPGTYAVSADAFGLRRKAGLGGYGQGRRYELQFVTRSARIVAPHRR